MDRIFRDEEFTLIARGLFPSCKKKGENNSRDEVLKIICKHSRPD